LVIFQNKNHFLFKHYNIVVGTEDRSSAASARTLLLKALSMGIGCISPDPVTQASKNIIAQAPRWLKINDGSTTMLAQEP